MRNIEQLVLDENNVAFHPMFGNSYKLNEIGSQIINLLKQKKTKDEIVEILHDKYDVDKDTLFIDINDFISKMKIYGLLS